MEQEKGITIKGTREGLTVFVSQESPLEEVLQHLKEKLSGDSTFFRDAELILDLGLRPFQEGEFRSLHEVFDSFGIRLKGILSDNPITKLMASEEGIQLLGDRSILHSRIRVDHPVRRERSAVHEREVPEEREEKRKNGSALFLHKTLRAGQKLHYAGDVTVLGDVNPGAEVVASGNIVVFGSLRGMAHAGAEGRKEAVVVALDLKPTQLRIADCIARPPENLQGSRVPELARVQDESIVIEVYSR